MLTIVPSLITWGFLACGEKESDNTEDTSVVVDTEIGFDDFINSTTPAVGDMTCFTATSGVLGHEMTAADWIQQNVDNTKVANVQLIGSVIDFQTEEPVEAAFVDLFWGNSISAQSDSTAESDADGGAAVEFQACSPYTYRVYTDPAWGETKVTIEANTVEKPSVSETKFNSVSTGTYNVIPAIYAVTPDPAMGIVAGTVFDCTEEALEGAQVIVRDAEGTYPSSQIVRYFNGDNFPSQEQQWTNTDGLWIAMEIPEGTWFVDAYVADGNGGHMILGTTTIQVFKDSINIANIYTGFGDGIKYPEECLLAE